MEELKLKPICQTCKFAKGLDASVFCTLDECTMAWNAAKGCKRWEVRD